MEAQRYKRRILEFSHICGARGGGQVRGRWMCGGRGSDVRGR